MTTTRPKCRSKFVPCPAGDRCPEHRGMVKALNDAAQAGKFDDFLQVKTAEKAELDAEREAALESATIKKNRKGELIVRLPARKRNVFSKQYGSLLAPKVVNVYTTSTATVNLGAKHPADEVDKTQVIATGGLFTKSVTFDQAVEEAYDGKVKFVTGKGGFDVNAIDSIELPEDYKGHGIESHVIASYLNSSRTDLYDFVGKETIPFEAYKAQGFEPNPYYWAGRTHPDTGVTYPTVEQLNELDSDSAGSERGLHTGQRNPEYAYMRLKYGKRVTDIPFTVIKDWSREERHAVSVIRGERQDNFQKTKASGSANFSQS